MSYKKTFLLFIFLFCGFFSFNSGVSAGTSTLYEYTDSTGSFSLAETSTAWIYNYPGGSDDVSKQEFPYIACFKEAVGKKTHHYCYFLTKEYRAANSPKAALYGGDFENRVGFISFGFTTQYSRDVSYYNRFPGYYADEFFFSNYDIRNAVSDEIVHKSDISVSYRFSEEIDVSNANELRLIVDTSELEKKGYTFLHEYIFLSDEAMSSPYLRYKTKSLFTDEGLKDVTKIIKLSRVGGTETHQLDIPCTELEYVFDVSHLSKVSININSNLKILSYVLDGEDYFEEISLQGKAGVVFIPRMFDGNNNLQSNFGTIHYYGTYNIEVHDDIADYEILSRLKNQKDSIFSYNFDYFSKNRNLIYFENTKYYTSEDKGFRIIYDKRYFTYVIYNSPFDRPVIDFPVPYPDQVELPTLDESITDSNESGTFTDYIDNLKNFLEDLRSSSDHLNTIFDMFYSSLPKIVQVLGVSLYSLFLLFFVLKMGGWK